MKLTTHDLVRMIDLSAVRGNDSLEDIRTLAEQAAKHHCVCAFALPCFTADLRRLLAGAPDVGVGGVVGFPSGAHTTAIKAAEARRGVADGATELDMVINIGWLRSGEDRMVEEDIHHVVEAGEGRPVKVILECHYLTDDQIRRASEVCVRAGAAFVKTGTGWAPAGATAHNVALIKSAVGEAAKIKAAGGVRSLATMLELYRCGATRFGISLSSGLKVLEEIMALPGGSVEVP